MASTLRETLQAALELIQVYGAGEKLGSADAARGVQVANSILEEWSLDSLACYAMRELTVPLKYDKSVYLYGPDEEVTTYTDIYEYKWASTLNDGIVFLRGGPNESIYFINYYVDVGGTLPVNPVPKPTESIRVDAPTTPVVYYPDLKVGTIIRLAKADSKTVLKTPVGDIYVRIIGLVLNAPSGVLPNPGVTPNGATRAVSYRCALVSGDISNFNLADRNETWSWSQAYIHEKKELVSADYPERPTGLMGGPNSAYITDANGTRFPVQLVDLGTWNQIANTKIIKSNIPTTAYYRANFPRSEVWLYPTPTNDTYTFTIQAYNNFDTSKLDDEIALPPGYHKAMLYALGKELWPFYRQGDVPPAVVIGANDSLAAIKRSNKQDLQANYDKQLLRRPNATYNIYRDNTR